MKDKFIQAYMDVAERFAQLSSAQRLHVGAIIVKDDRIISIGYNGMPSGWENCCENKIYMTESDNYMRAPGEIETVFPFEDDGGRYRIKSKPEVLHAETNAIAKLARSPESGEGATIFITHAPCLNCAKLIYQSGIQVVYYRTAYRERDGIEFLEKSGITVLQV
jgi:dCMP deaminase